ncbi:MAG: hypothetical protein U9N34_10470 [Candidatus Cloacimonadota bacterium]|nr:hypothetical protein [Candidatus Cloacimonadota bacterium]
MKKNELVEFEKNMEEIFPDGLSDEMLEYLISMEDAIKNRSYNRILSDFEKTVISPYVHGYLIELYSIGSIEKEEFERILAMVIAAASITKRDIKQKEVQKLIDLVNTNPQQDFTIKRIVEALNKPSKRKTIKIN